MDNSLFYELVVARFAVLWAHFFRDIWMGLWLYGCWEVFHPIVQVVRLLKAIVSETAPCSVIFGIMRINVYLTFNGYDAKVRLRSGLHFFDEQVARILTSK